MITLCRHCGKEIEWLEAWRDWIDMRFGNPTIWCLKNLIGYHDPVRDEGAKR